MVGAMMRSILSEPLHSMPTMVEQLAEANPDTSRRVLAAQYPPAGSHLANAAHNPSQVPALPYWLVHQSFRRSK
jgi:hypothetical protein